MDILVYKAKKHDKEAYTQLMLSVGPGLYKVGRGILANDEDVADAMQETALLGWEKIHTIRYTGYFKTWITRIMINVCNEMLRKRKRLVVQEEIPERGMEDWQYADAEWKQLFLPQDADPASYMYMCCPDTDSQLTVSAYAKEHDLQIVYVEFAVLDADGKELNFADREGGVLADEDGRQNALLVYDRDTFEEQNVVLGYSVRNTEDGTVKSEGTVTLKKVQ